MQDPPTVHLRTPMLLRTLGVIRLEDADSDLSGRKKALALLAYLARKAPRPVGRAELADLLWQDRDESRARQSLRQALLELKRVVGDGLTTEAEEARLDPQALRLDVREFESAIAGGRLEEAMGWWEGDFLAGLEESGGEALRVWLEVERETLRRGLALVFERLSADSFGRGDWDRTIGLAERWSRFLPHDDRAHIRLVETLCLAGRPSEAQVRHSAIIARLRVELEREPSAELEALGARIQRELSRDHLQHRPGSATLFTPDLVGRAAALAELDAGWESARSGERTVVLVEGETGIGKTRLIEEFVRRVQASGSAIVLGVQAGVAGASGESLIEGILSRLASAPGLAGASPTTLSVIAARVPKVRERFPGAVSAGGDMDLDGAAVEAISVVAEEHPVLLFWDDVERASAATRASVANLARSVVGRVLLILAVGEEDGTGATATALGAGARPRRLKLPPLSPAEVETLVASMLVLPASDRHVLAARLHEEGGGNPLYTIELVATLVDEGVLTIGERGTWTLADPQRWPVLLSGGLRTIISRRTEALSEDARAVAEAVARLEPVANDAAARDAANLPGDRFDAGRDELIARRLLRTAPSPGGGYQFHHQLVRRVILDQADRRWRNAQELAAARQPGQARHRWLAAATGAALAVAVGFWLARERDPATLDANLVAVAPFDVLDPRLAVWREGMVDILSRSLDGAGPLRTATPSVVIQRWRGRADASSAGALGRRTGAGLVVIGRLMGSGRDSVRVTASIVGTGGQQVLGDIDRRAPIDRMDQLADTVAVALLSELNRTRPIGAFRLASVGASSLAALKAYLQGEQLLRRAAYDSALVQYRRAIELDSSFALALRRTSMAINWSGNIYDTLATIYALRAGRLNRRLAPRDSLLVAADSQSYALYDLIATGDSGFVPLQRRLFQTLATTVARYPDSPEVWFTLGETQYHFGSGGDLTTSNAQVLRTFERTISLDSTFVPSYEHAVDLSLLLDDEDRARRYARGMVRHGGPGVNGGGMRLVLAALDSGYRRGGDLDQMLDSASSSALDAVHYVLWKTADSGEIALRALRAVHRRPTGLYGGDSVWTANILAALLEQHGHPREACAGVDPRRLVWPLGEVYRNCALIGVVPADSVDVGLRTALAEYGRSGEAGDVVRAGLLWWNARGDTSSLVRAQRRAAELQRSAPDRPTRTLNARLAAGASAFLALARRDTAQAISRLTEIVKNGCVQFGCDDEGLTLGEVLTAHGDAREGYAVLRGLIESRLYKNVPIHLALGRAAERIGEKAQAIAAYRFVARARAKGDPEAQPYVAEARAGIERLLSETRPVARRPPPGTEDAPE